MGSSSEAGSGLRKRKKPPRPVLSSAQATSSTATGVSESGISERAKYRCTHEHNCHKAFDRKADLDRHLLVHDTSFGYVCDECKGIRKVYIFGRKDHLRSHLKRIHPKQAIRDDTFESYLRHLTPEEQEQKAATLQHRGSSSGGAVPGSSRAHHPADPQRSFGGASSIASRSSESSARTAKRSRKVQSPAVHNLIDSRMLHSSELSSSSVEDGQKRHRATSAIELEPSDWLPPPSDSDDPYGLKMNDLFTEEESMPSTSFGPSISLRQLDRIWEDTENWNQLSDSGSSRSVLHVMFELPQHQRRQAGNGASASGGQEHRPSRMTRMVNRFLNEPVYWNPMALRFPPGNGPVP